MNIFKTGLLLLIGVFIMGCNLFTRTIGMSGNVQINLSVQESRTVIPEVTPAITEFRITFSEGPETLDPFTTTSESINLNIPQGMWTIAIEGLNVSGSVVATGRETGIVVTIDDMRYVSIALSATAGGNGSIDIAVDWSAADLVTVNSVSAELDGVPIDPANLEETATSIRYTENKSSGSYMLFFDLDAVAVAEAVHVYDNLTSSATIYLDNDDFNLAPAAPDNLQATTVSSSQIDLVWNDNSNNEEGFKIERSSDGISFSLIDSVPAGTGTYSDIGLNSDTEYHYRVRAYNNIGDSDYSNTSYSTTNPTTTPTLIINHESISLFDSIPSIYIDEVKKSLLILAGESHGRAYGYGLELVESEDLTYDSDTNWSGAAETYTDQYLRWNRAFLDNTTWNTSLGEEDFFTNSAAIEHTLNGLNTIEDNYKNGNEIVPIYFGFGWCWDMTWTNAPTVEKDSIYGCGWAGSTSGGPDGNLPWGLDDSDYVITGNTVNLQTYLETVDYYNNNSPNVKTIFTTGPVDNLSNSENGYQRHLKHEAIRDYVINHGGILLDYADILSWDYVSDQPHQEQWTDSNSNTHIWNGRNPMLASGGTGFDGGDGGSHISEEGCLLLGKAIWVMLALDAGWNGL